MEGWTVEKVLKKHSLWREFSGPLAGPTAIVLQFQDQRIAALKADLAAAHTQCGYNQLTINALGDRIAALEQLLRDVRPWIPNAPYALPARIDAALGSSVETVAKHVEGCRCPECDPDYNDPRNTDNRGEK